MQLACQRSSCVLSLRFTPIDTIAPRPAAEGLPYANPCIGKRNLLRLNAPADASLHTHAAPVPPSTACTAASSTDAHAPASPGSRADPHPPPACAFRTHAAAYADAHPPPARGSAQSA